MEPNICLPAAVFRPGAAQRVEQHLRADDVRPHEGTRLRDRPVDVRLCREVYDRIDRVLGEQLCDDFSVCNVTANEADPTTGFQTVKGGEVAGIGQGIDHNKAILRMLAEPVVHEVTSDEPRATGD